MIAREYKTCPTCGSHIIDPRKPKRICARCGETIRRNHKWGFGLDGRCEHRDCGNPSMTVATVETVQQVELAEVGKCGDPEIEVVNA